MSSKVRLAQHDGHVFVVFVAMTPKQVQVVQQSFRLLATRASEATDIFYRELFRIAPDTRRLFPNDMTEHKGKFVQMLATVVKSLDNVSGISEPVADLGRRHAGYDVREGDYDLVGQALLSMLHRLLGARCTPEIRDAWAAAYGMLARLMKEAAAEPHPASSYFSHVVHGGMTARYGISSEFEFDAHEKKHGVTQPHSHMRRARHP
jgi:hemoglobin-like flavoprotein